MLRLSKLTDYAVVVLTRLDDAAEGGVLTAPGLAGATGLAEPTVAKVLKILAHAGLVEGRRGARRWANDAEVEQTMKSMRMKLEEMYDFSLISPATAEKLHKAGVIGPRQWPKLQAGETYYVVSAEAAGGDLFYGTGPTVPCAGDDVVRSPVVNVLPDAAAAGVVITGSVRMDAATGVWQESGEGLPRAFGTVNFAVVM